jgi:hypothetical protein
LDFNALNSLNKREQILGSRLPKSANRVSKSAKIVPKSAKISKNIFFV